MNKNIFAAALVAIGLLALGLCIRSGLVSFSNRTRTVDVRGLAERDVPANKVTWPLVYKLVGNDLPALYDQCNATNARIAAFLKSNGITDAEIGYNAPSLEDLQANRYGNEPIPYRYRMTNVLTVVSTNVALVNSLIKRQGELLKEGIALTVDYNNRTIYEYTGLNEIKPEMIAEATENARQAAEKFADDSNSDIGDIVKASQGQFSIEDRDPYTPDIKHIRVVTYLTYSIK
ncbi:MAG: SIMPL domain-containing protein [Muribaculaceae bacterium]|nr:SIMPL domain-containing protein [Bacteroidales bacterium]MDE6040893.1 SIMPL domain-containing protein [Muribaculaceae bacterium]